MYFAHTSIFIAVARILYVFNTTKARDEFGNEIVPKVEYDGFIRYVKTSTNSRFIYGLKSARALVTLAHFLVPSDLALPLRRS